VAQAIEREVRRDAGLIADAIAAESLGQAQDSAEEESAEMAEEA
jgi:hypothetical protein